MNRYTFTLAILFITAFSAQCQQTESKSATAPTAVKAYANGNDTYLQFDESYDADKKYTVFKIWNEKEPLTEKEKTDLAYLKKQLAKKNIEVVDAEWKNKEDLEAIFKKYNLSVDVRSDEHINLKGGDFNLNTTSAKALVVFQNEKPLSLCSGKDCEERLKTFFKLRSTD
jgi:hypothetical protein